ncbi:hypothetical protein MSROBK_003210 [Spiroplasma poulsonii]|uniref:Uncharacterized protein n=1 Tax=Spiroplasma poulsonii TaxID=2138 RepID=A0A2P6FAQ3_9MOLU|nr:hypothetical protein MSROBK_003210 [Spiroplasma poulsonii]PQM30520.1 hypothetical protein SMSRO_SF002890 [Spiroplasma poulsonii]PWF95493.1 hypothetical protein SMSE_09220 [Spiroplasma poulsonii]PWF98276.1 hypothetical protein SMH99_08300 [Spiroplasma poulsonii]
MKKMLLTAIIMVTSMNVVPLNYKSQQNNDLNNIITAKEQITLTNDDLGFFKHILIHLWNYKIIILILRLLKQN